MRVRADLKKTIHNYKGFTIHGGQRNTEGGYVLCGRYYVEGGITRQYTVKKDGKYVFNPNDIFGKLSHIKEEIDNYIKRTV